MSRDSMRFYDDVDGNTYRRENGRWRRITPQERAIREESATTSFGEAASLYALQGFVGLAQLAEAGANYMFTGRGDAFRNENLAALAEDTQQQLELRGQVAPTATAAGEAAVIGGEAVGGELLLGAARAGSRAATQAAARSAARRRTRREAAGKIPPKGTVPSGTRVDEMPDGTVVNLREDEISKQDWAEYGQLLEHNGFGTRNAGAAQASDAAAIQATHDQIANMAENSGWGARLWSGLAEVLGGAPRPLSPDQSAIINSGVADRLGFQWLPGQLRGDSRMDELILSRPHLARAYDARLAENADKMSQYTMRALGMEGELLGRDILYRSDEVFETAFGGIGNRMGSVSLTREQLEAMAEQGMTKNQADTLLRALEKGEGSLSGAKVMNLRSRLSKRASNAMQRNELPEAEEIYEQIDILDAEIDKAFARQGDHQARAEWKDWQQRYRVRVALDDAIKDDGTISFKKLNNQLERVFEKEYKNRLFAQRTGPDALGEDIANLLDFNRAASAFQSNLGDSGTATRMAIRDYMSLSGLKTVSVEKAAAAALEFALENGDIIAPPAVPR